MAAFSKHLTARNAALVGTAIVAYKFLTSYSKKKNGSKGEEVKLALNLDKNKRKDKAAVDGVFFRRLVNILKILVPGVLSKEAFYVVMVALSLAARTYCDVWMIQNGTAIESAIIGRSMTLFKHHLFRFMWAMPAISLINNLLKFGLNELKLRFRTRLTNHLYSKYLTGFTYYKMSNLDNRIANADQLLTQDVEKFCNSVAELYSNLSKPILDIVIYATKLASSIGPQGPGIMLLYLLVSGLILTKLRSPIGKMTVVEQRLEGEFRYVNSRLITNSEEIAFYQGNRKEQAIIRSTFRKLENFVVLQSPLRYNGNQGQQAIILVDHLRHVICFRFSMGLVDNIIAKYIATVFGYLVVSRPFLDLTSKRHINSTHSQLLEDYYQSGRMLVKMAEAIGRIVLAGREMTRLSGFTARVTEFMTVLQDVNSGRYKRTMVASDKKDNGKQDAENALQLQPGSGELITQDYIIKFENVPLVTPNGDVLVKELNFEVKSGLNVLVCGPNGCGKSSLFRILGELWPMFGGKVTKPHPRELFYIPQRPYMTLGTLRDQVIYPDSHKEQLDKGWTDASLEKILDEVQLSYILDREGGWETVQDWMDVLSGGEKQRIAMARLFYHKPQFAILDECTSAVSVDVEGFMYQHCREVGITLFTVSHRKSLWKHHEFYLHMDGRGSFEFKPISSNTVEFGS